MITRREFAGICAAAWGAGVVKASEFRVAPGGRVSVQVLQLLKPTQATVRPAGTTPIEFANEHGKKTIWPGHSQTGRAMDAPFSAQGRGPADVALQVTLGDGFTRNYFGRLSGKQMDDGRLLLVIDMPVEVAVGSIIGAELPTHGAARAALAGQAVVARSYLAASGRRHEHADFCDTTHCQFLRSPAPRGSMVEQAAEKTRDLVLTADGKPFPALYSAACGGETEQREEGGYQYQRVRCDVCTASNRARSGHGLGLCQNAALALGQQGWGWERIIEKYYPGAVVGKYQAPELGAAEAATYGSFPSRLSEKSAPRICDHWRSRT